MSKSLSVTTLKSRLNKLKTGDRVYINAIGLSLNAIEYLRDEIKSGHLIPDYHMINKVFAEEYREQALNGVVICPQCDYTVWK